MVMRLNPPNHTAKMPIGSHKRGQKNIHNSPALSDSQIPPCPQHLAHPKSSTAHAVPSRLAVVAPPHRRRRSLANMPREMGPNYPRFFSGQFGQEKTKCNNADINFTQNIPKHMLLGDLPHVNHHISGRVLTPSDNPS